MAVIIDVFLILLAAYAGLGLLFGIYFFARGASQIDPGIKDSKWTVRLLLTPGAIALWCVLFPKLLKARKS